MAIEWDETKNRANQVKHGLSFETASLVFDDSLSISFPERNVEGEDRWWTIGSPDGIVLLTVAHTLAGFGDHEIVRIVSARKATPSERKLYEEEAH
jgi:hypothetical protein